jgi:hypothetical protein
MNRKVIITLLTLVLVVALYSVFSNATTAGETETNLPGEIQPIEGLKASFEASLRDPVLAIAELACFPTSRFNCYQTGCKPAAPGAYFFVDYGTEGGTYFRCDVKGCDSYPVKVTRSGLFTHFIPSENQAMLFKVITEDILLGDKGEFVDVATLGLGTLVSYGKCQERR